MAVYHIESITIRDKSVIPVRVQWPTSVDYQSTNEVTGDEEVVTYKGEALGVDQSSYFLRMRMDDGTLRDLRNSDIVSVFQEYEVESGSTIYWGASLVPPPNLGKLTDVYIAKNGDCYSLTETGWQYQTNIRGPQGPVGPTPKVGVNGNWFINGKDTGIAAKGDNGKDGASPTIDPTTKHWFLKGVDLGVCAEGQTPYIGANGNWFIGTTDTGVLASGTTLLPAIDPTTKHWIISGVDSGVKAEGVDGKTPTIDPASKHWFIDGVDTGVMAEGVGLPVNLTINATTKNWEIDGVDTGVPATGPQGPAGRDGKDGESFQLYAVYTDVADMNTDEPTIPENSFVALVTNTDVKIYIKSDGYVPGPTDSAESMNNFIWIKNLTDAIQIAGTPGRDGQTPHIDPITKHWMIGTVDTGVSAEPLIPYVGASGNWMVGMTDTGVSAQGTAGTSPHIDATTKHWMIGTFDTGVLAEAPLPSIHPTTFNWVVNGVDTGISAKGTDGLTPYIGGNGHWFVGATDTGVNASGAFPVIDATTKNWFIDGVDTGVSAVGPAGATPTITIDATTKNWMINGLDTGVCSVGANGLTPAIGANGNWFIGTTDTGVNAAGVAGTTPHIDPTSKHWFIGTTDTGILAEAKVDQAEIDALKKRMNSLIASKHSLGEVDYTIAYSSSNGSTSVAANGNMCALLPIRKGNMVWTSDNCVTLRPNRVYKATAAIMATSGNHQIRITDKAGVIYGNVGRTDPAGTDVPAIGLIEVGDNPIELYVNIAYVGGTSKVIPMFLYLIVEEICNPKDIDPVEYIMHDDGIEDTPVGTIVPYMGDTAPKHFLACDGTVYKIDDYPDLAAHFVDQFGAAEHFGGDGITTFAVPDMRGEFLRGAGANGHTKQGSGAAIGEHQDATAIPDFVGYNNQIHLFTENLGGLINVDVSNRDSIVSGRAATLHFNSASSSNQNFGDSSQGKYTTRPTNTSVLWCIKCEKTPFVQIVNETLGIKLDEVVFDQNVTSGGNYTLPCVVKDTYDAIHASLVYVSGSTTYATFDHSYVPIDKSSTIPIKVTLRDIDGSNSIRITISITGDNLTVTGFNKGGSYNVANLKVVIRGVVYGKATGGGTTDISKDPDNQLVEKPDGLFVPKALSDISKDAGNLIEKKADGIFADVPISAEPDNGLEKKTDGFYVENVSERLRLKVNLLSRAKHTTEEVQFFFATKQIADLPYGTGLSSRPKITSVTNILSLLPSVTTNMEVTNDSFIKLLADRTYSIEASALIAHGDQAVVIAIVDDSGNIVGAKGYQDGRDGQYGYCSARATITPATDMLVCVKIGIDGMAGQLAWPTGVSMQFPDDFSYVFIQEINNAKEIDPVEYIMGEDGIEASPVGNIISYMGTTPPEHYLACDGTEYQIADYAQLAQHFIDAFGAVNHFGGDGVDTFCVPDLRGEFLRGSGTNSRTGQGSGTTVGTHQDATKLPKIHFYQTPNGSDYWVGGETAYNQGGIENRDSATGSAQGTLYGRDGYNMNVGVGSTTQYTVRPTNTSVMYCIKYESTPFVQFVHSSLGVELNETVVDTAILAQGKTVTLSCEPNKKYDELRVTFYNPTTGTILNTRPVYTDASTNKIVFLIQDVTKGGISRNILSITGNVLKFDSVNVDTYDNSNKKILIRGIKYAKATGGSATVDPDPTNAIENRANGLYAPKVADAKISAEAGNELEKKADGLFVGSHDDLRKRINQLHASKNFMESYDWLFMAGKEPGGSNTATDGTYSTVSISTGSNLVSVLRPVSDIKGTMEVTTDGYIKLNANRTYRIMADTESNDAGFTVVVKVVDRDGKLYPAYQRDAATMDTTALYSVIEVGDTPIEVALIIRIYGTNSPTSFKIYPTWCHISVEEFGFARKIDPVEYVMKDEGIEDNPVGTVIPFMGKNPPKHYLACDGTEYQITDYPYLAEFFRTEFGSVNHYGGDGVDTFKVPDLRGEFLRGAGENSHADQGDGANVGVHQDATNHQYTRGFNNTNAGMDFAQNAPSNTDTTTQTRNDYRWVNADQSLHTGNIPDSYTSRPTNTNVLWCIKAEPTPFVQVQEPIVGIELSEEFLEITNITNGAVSTLDFEPNKRYDEIITSMVSLSDGNHLSTTRVITNPETNRIFYISNDANSNGCRRIPLIIEGNTVTVYNPSVVSLSSNFKLVLRGIKYEKTNFDEVIKKINQLHTAKTTKEPMDWFFATSTEQSGTNPVVNITNNTSFLSYLSVVKGTMEKTTDGYLKLRPNKTYKITADWASCATNGDSTNPNLRFFDRNGAQYPSNGNMCTAYSGNAAMTVIEVGDTPMEIIPRITFSGGTTAPTYGGWMYLMAEEVGYVREVDPTEYVIEEEGIEDVPVGTIAPFMGTEAPKHYLICDGSEYQVTDYPHLAEHFRTHFGAVNHFGGDGVNTFHVPDLRGEFLRGSGENSHTDQGDGADSGEHQDATVIPAVGIEGGTGRLFAQNTPTTNAVNDTSGHLMALNKDSSLNPRTVTNKGATTTAAASWNSSVFDGSGTEIAYTARPTNTSVLWCIKAEPTPFVQVLNPTLGVKANEVIFDQAVTLNGTYTLSCDPKTKYDELVAELWYTTENRSVFSSSYLIRKDTPILFDLWTAGNSGSAAYGSRYTISISGTTLKIPRIEASNNPFTSANSKIIIHGIKYETVTGGGSGSAEISAEADNQLVQKPDGLYVPKGLSDISSATGNKLEEKTDGLYVGGEQISTDSGNAIKKKANGLYVEDIPDKMRYQLNMINRTKHAVEDVEFFYATSCYDCNASGAPSRPNLTGNCNPIKLFRDISTNMTIDKTNGWVFLHANRTYMIQADVTLNTANSDWSCQIIDTSKRVYGNRGFHTNSGNWTFADPLVILTPENDMWIGAWINYGVMGDAWPSGGKTEFADDYSCFSIIEINHPKEIDPVAYLNEEEGIEDVSIGTIVPFMGTEPPKHYLACDGTEYSIADYPQLVQHFVDHFGSANHFGGDGISTFKVPDLRGEFLRGIKDGGTPGTHQPATNIPFMDGCTTSNGTPFIRTFMKSMANDSTNAGTQYDAKTLAAGLIQVQANKNTDAWITGGASPATVAVRPTNTSVLWCIKYESTPVAQFVDNVLGVKLNEVLYNGSSAVGTYTLPFNPKDRYDHLVLSLVASGGDQNRVYASTDYYLDADTPDEIGFTVSDYEVQNTSTYAHWLNGKITGTTLNIIKYEAKTYTVSTKLVIRGIKYQKAEGGEVNISSASGNALVEKSDGLYVPTPTSTSADISKEANNALVKKSDGLFVPATSSVTISQEAGNEIEQKSDGIYVGSHDDLRKRINEIHAAKYTTKKSDWLFMTGNPETSNNSGWWNVTGVVTGDNVIEKLSPYCTQAGTIELTSDHYIPLQANKTYHITVGISTDGGFGPVIVDRSGNRYHSVGREGQRDDTDTLNCVIQVGEEPIEVTVTTLWHDTANNGNKIFFCSSYILVEEFGSVREIDPVEWAMNDGDGIEDVPVGTITPFMGITAPKHYLACDGTVYNIVDWPHLAQHFNEAFGSVNHFGGDGTTTFAVPDLRGEFLRGTGENANANQGSGAAIGEHQAATEVLDCRIDGNQNLVATVQPTNVQHADKIITNTGFEWYIPTNKTSGASSAGRPYMFTTRPTNTSVLWCIKAEPTPYFQMQEVVTGVTLNDVIFDQAVALNGSYTLPCNVKGTYDMIEASLVCTISGMEIIMSNERFYVSPETTEPIRFMLNDHLSDTNNIRIRAEIVGSALTVPAYKVTDESSKNPRIVLRGIKFAKAEGGNVTIDPDTDNALEERATGLFVPKVADTKVSATADNILQKKNDGLYVPPQEPAVSTATGNVLTKKTDGLYVPTPADASVSPDSGNQLTRKTNGLYVAKQEPTVSPDSGNILVKKANGLYVPKPTTYTDAEVEAAVMDVFYPQATSRLAAIQAANATTSTTSTRSMLKTSSLKMAARPTVSVDEPTVEEELTVQSVNKLNNLMVESPNEALTTLSTLMAESPNEALTSMSKLAVQSPNEALASFSTMAVESPDGALSTLSRISIESPNGALSTLSRTMISSPNGALGSFSRIAIESASGSYSSVTRMGISAIGAENMSIHKMDDIEELK